MNRTNRIELIHLLGEERHQERFERKSTSSGFVIYWGLKLKEVL